MARTGAKALSNVVKNQEKYIGTLSEEKAILVKENARLTALVSKIKSDCEMIKSEGVNGVSEYNAGLKMQAYVTLGFIEVSEAGS